MKPSTTTLLPLLLAALLLLASSASASRRQRRSILSFPNNSSVTVGLDLTWPITHVTKEKHFFTIALPFRFWVPTYDQLVSEYSLRSSSGEDDAEEGNEIDVDRFHAHQKERANRERRYVYKHIESIFSSFGWNGLACLQRAICELSGAPVGHNDLFGNIMTLLLTPPHVDSDNYVEPDGKCPDCDLLDRPYHDEYATAYHHGRREDASCADRYHDSCPISLFSIFYL